MKNLKRVVIIVLLLLLFTIVLVFLAVRQYNNKVDSNNAAIQEYIEQTIEDIAESTVEESTELEQTTEEQAEMEQETYRVPVIERPADKDFGNLSGYDSPVIFVDYEADRYGTLNVALNTIVNTEGISEKDIDYNIYVQMSTIDRESGFVVQYVIYRNGQFTEQFIEVPDYTDKLDESWSASINQDCLIYFKEGDYINYLK